MRLQAFTTATLIMCAQAALAAAPDLSVQLNLLEAKVTGKHQMNLSLAERVEALEKVVHGQARTGSLVKRVKNLATVTGGSTSANLKTAQTPKLDSADSAPPSVPTAAAEKPAAKAKPHAVTKKSGSPHTAHHKPAAVRPALDQVLRARVEEDIRLGIRHHRAGNVPAAEQCFRRVCEADPANSNGHYNLGVLYEQVGALQSALVHYRAAWESCPNDEEILEAIAAVNRKLEAATAPPGAATTATTALAAPPPQFSYPAGIQPYGAQAAAPAPAPDFTQQPNYQPVYQAGPFHASNPGTPLLQGNAQQADIAGGLDQTTAALSAAGGIQPNGQPLKGNAGTLAAGSARPSHPIRRRLLYTAAAVGIGAASRISTGSGIGNILFSGARRGLGCPTCHWISGF
jgi:Flp pilus assembly protein TadD